MIPLLFFYMCISISISNPTSCSDWQVYILADQETVQNVWDYRGYESDYPVHAFTDPKHKQIIIYNTTDFSHEWRHAYCQVYYFYHLANNHPTICEPFPHWRLAELDSKPLV